MLAAIKAGERPDVAAIEAGAPYGYAAMVQQCWQGDPAGRPSAADVWRELETLSRLAGMAGGGGGGAGGGAGAGGGGGGGGGGGAVTGAGSAAGGAFSGVTVASLLAGLGLGAYTGALVGEGYMYTTKRLLATARKNAMARGRWWTHWGRAA